MIYFTLEVSNPFSNLFKSLKEWSGTLTTNKNWEVQIMRTRDIFCARFEYTPIRDHAGVYIEFGLLSFNLSFSVYDRRHRDIDDWNS
jgi:hypothetical protein